MKQYCVQMIEEYRQDMYVDANSPEEARELVQDGKGTEGELHYSHTVDADEWLVFECK